jgi:hypothetical protein
MLPCEAMYPLRGYSYAMESTPRLPKEVYGLEPRGTALCFRTRRSESYAPSLAGFFGISQAQSFKIDRDALRDGLA